MENNTTPDRFNSLDVLRGVAALCVVFWHWQHFFYGGTELYSGFSFIHQPLVGIFLVAYGYGWLAVDIFFCLSGFIFYWLYSEQVANRKISAARFFILRFSRLYPLHFLSLLIVAFGQLNILSLTHAPYVYPYNDLYHFTLNIFFISGWGFEQGYSFNAPVWSVSIEVALYCLFFVLTRLLPVKLIVLLSLSVLGAIISIKTQLHIGSGMASFFMGGCCYLAYKNITGNNRIGCARFLMLLTIVLWSVAALSIHFGRGISTMPFLWRLAPLYPIYVLFPVTVLVLSLYEIKSTSFFQRFAVLGDISYAVYMLHFPLQLFIMEFVVRLKIDRAVFYLPSVLFGFICLLLVISYISHYYFERTVQKWIRRRFIPGRQQILSG